MRCRRSIAFLLLSAAIAAAPASQAEIYAGIGPLDRLKDVKEKLPGATYERLKPAWGQPEDALYKVTGRGISGTIIIKFYDLRPSFRSLLGSETDPKQRKIYEEAVKSSDDEAMSAEWVRWVPDTLIPLERFISKYGQPEKKGFTDDDMQPYRAWLTKGLTAYISDSESFVIRVDYDFTKGERRQAFQTKYGFVPDYLKQE